MVLPLERGGSSAVGRGQGGWPNHDQQHCYHHVPTVKPEAATAVVELLMMGVRTPETCWAVSKRQAINLRNCCIWLVDSFESYFAPCFEYWECTAVLGCLHVFCMGEMWPHEGTDSLEKISVCPEYGDSRFLLHHIQPAHDLHTVCHKSVYFIIFSE